MSNSYFQFKQFIVEQERCAMKVSTDACIQGAWSPVLPAVKKVLDIGCGTGLLSLMLAQKDLSTIIDALELDMAAAEQASRNVASSPWADRINVNQADVRAYEFVGQYDMAICNPPFFINSLQAPDAARNSARHDVSLSQEELFKVISTVLQPRGYASVMLPPREHEQWEQLCERNGWNIFRKLVVHPRLGVTENRIVSLCDRGSRTRVGTETLIIRNSDNTYSAGFTELLRPFYLSL